MVEDTITRILIEVLGLSCTPDELQPEFRLLGAIPEFDSMAVISILTAIEEHYGVSVDDDEIEAASFETLGTLCAFVASKLAD